MTDFEQLLIVQAHDTHADQLRHRRAALPERVRVAELRDRIAALTKAEAAQETARADLAREQRRREDELASLDAKIKAEDARLYGGTVSNPRELQALQDEIAAMKRRVSAIEDAILELLDQLEPVQTELAALGSAHTELEADLARTEEALTVNETEIDIELASVEAERSTLTEGIRPELLAEYEQLRSHGGVGVARLTGNRCEGCHLTMAAAEIDRIKRAGPDEVAHCEECGRILVH